MESWRGVPYKEGCSCASCCQFQLGWYISGFRIRIDLMRIRIRIRIRIFANCGSGFRIPDPDPRFDDLKLEKIYSWKFNFDFLDQKLLFTYPQASIKDTQATGEAFSPQKRTSSTSKHKNSVHFSIYMGHFCPPVVSSRQSDSNADRIRVFSSMIFKTPTKKKFTFSKICCLLLSLHLHQSSKILR